MMSIDMGSSGRPGFLIQAVLYVMAALGVAGCGSEGLIEGRIVNQASGEGVGDVYVFNGETFTRTNADGSFSIAADPELHRFIHIASPTGMRPVGDFYQTVRGIVDGAAGEVIFELVPAPERESSSFTFVHASDSHFSVDANTAYAVPDEVAEDFSLIAARENPAFFVMTGDMTDYGTMEDLETYAAILADLPVPTYSVYGGHDGIAAVRFDVDYGTLDPYERFLGPTAYAFDWGGWHFLVYPELFFPEEQQILAQTKEWFWSYLAELSPDANVVVLTHDPARFHSAEGQAEYAPSAARLRAEHPGVRLVLHGQYHTVREVAHDGLTISAVTSISIPGIDTTPRGYSTVTTNSNGVSIEHHLIESTLETPPRPPRSGSSDRVTRVWSQQLPRGVHRATPSIEGNIAIISLADQGATGEQGLIALDVESGEPRWRLKTDSTVKNTVGTNTHDLADRLFALTVAGQLYSVQLSTGGVEWQTQLPRYPDRWLFPVPIVQSTQITVAQYSGSTALDARSGEILWNVGDHWENGWSPVYQRPPSDDTHFFTLTTASLGDYVISAHRLVDGGLAWSRVLNADNDGEARLRLYQLEYASPLIHGDLLIVPGLGDRILALDRRNGEVVWDRPVVERAGLHSGLTVPSGYVAVREQASGLAASADDMLFATTSNGAAFAVDIATGDVRWSFVTEDAPIVNIQPYIRDAMTTLTEPLVVDDALVFGSVDGHIYRLNRRTGELIDREWMGGAVTAPPVQTEHGLLVATIHGHVSMLRYPDAEAQ